MADLRRPTGSKAIKKTGAKMAFPVSHTPEDLMLDYLDESQAVAEEWQEREREIIESFTQDRLKSYYLAHPEVAQKAFKALSYSRTLLEEDHVNAALVFAGTAVELGYKAVLVRPLISGLVHTEALAEVVMGLATEHTGLDRFSRLLTKLLSTFADVDLRTFVRPDGERQLWDEMKMLASKRNDVVHGGENSSQEAATAAIKVAETLLNVLLPKVLKRIGLRIRSTEIVAE